MPRVLSHPSLLTIRTAAADLKGTIDGRREMEKEGGREGRREEMYAMIARSPEEQSWKNARCLSAKGFNNYSSTC